MIAAFIALSLCAAPQEEEPPSSWELEFSAWDTLVDPDSIINLYQSPVLRDEELEIRATWAVVWVDRAKWTDMSKRGVVEEDWRAPFQAPRVSGDEEVQGFKLFGQVELHSLDLAREVYLEGPLEIYRNGELMATGGAFYIDLIDGHGWIADARLTYQLQVGDETVVFRARADWMRHSADGSLQANDATVTTCGFEEPHIHFTTGDLRLATLPGDPKRGWHVEMQGNRIHLYDFLTLPLPPVSYDTDNEGKPLWPSITFADSARFGALVETVFRRDMGNVGKTINKSLGGDEANYDAHYRIQGSYLGSRGGLVDLGAEIESERRYWLNMYLGTVWDTGEDRGLIRVPEEERSDLRLWYRALGRYYFDDQQWLHLQLSTQTDPGVQAEFYENDFLRYELRENFLHWRKARDELYLSATVQPRLDEERTIVEELPTVRFSRLLSEVGRVGPLSLLYTTDVEAGYLSRKAGDPTYAEPFAQSGPFVDSLGQPLPDRQAFRIDNTHLFELPIPIGFAGIRAIPYALARVTAWSKAEDEDGVPSRAALIGGVRLASSFFKSTQGGSLIELAPFAGVRQDALLEENGGAPIRFGEVEQPIDGRYVDFGIRARLVQPAVSRTLDLEIAGSHGEDLPAGLEDGLQPVKIFAGLQSALFGRGFGIFHDGHYDLDDELTTYSRTSLGVEISPAWELEFGHRRGNAVDSTRDYEAATVATRLRWTPKWEIEGVQEYSLEDSGSLASGILLRRYGHDLVFELEVSTRSGEGGTSIGFNLRPALGFRPRRFTYIDPWRD